MIKQNQTVKEQMIAVQKQKELLLKDQYRPGYHFALLNEFGLPGDPNGGFFANGRYHLMYLYLNPIDGYRWGHVSSTDLLHWRYHHDAIGPTDSTGGCYSGGAYVENGQAYMTFWQLPQDYPPLKADAKNMGIGLAVSRDKHFDKWEKLEHHIIESSHFGYHILRDKKGNVKEVIGASDPSNIWKKGNKYYLLAGNLQVLNEYGRSKDALDQYKGDSLSLFESKDLHKWTYKDRFYQRNQNNTWTQESEDCMCASFLPLPKSRRGGKLSGKYLLLFISHNFGCQYYVGSYKKHKFYPEQHGRMSSYDRAFFAPEAIADDKNRQVFWAWLGDNISDENNRGWSGVFSLPRTVWFEDNRFKMAPVEEINRLRYNHKKIKNITVTTSGTVIEGMDASSLEINLNIKPHVKILICNRLNENEYTELYVDHTKKQIIINTECSGSIGTKKTDYIQCDDTLELNNEVRIFIDKSVIEFFVDDEYALTRRIYVDYEYIVKIQSNVDTIIDEIDCYEMMPTNPF